MKLGAERKRTALFGGLIAVLLLVLYFQFFSSSSPTDDPRPGAGNRAAKADERPAGAVPSTRPQAPDISRASPLRAGRSRPESGSSSGEGWRPSMKNKIPIDPMRADPTLHKELMAKVQAVALAGGERNLFQFGAPPPPKPVTPDHKIAVGQPGGPGATTAGGAKSTIPVGPPGAPDPPAPPIPLKFYGFTAQARQSNRRAFFLNGEEIIVASEGDVVMKRYKVVRIGVNSVVMEDMETKKQQPLPLEEQPG